MTDKEIMDRIKALAEDLMRPSEDAAADETTKAVNAPTNQEGGLTYGLQTVYGLGR